MIRFLIFALFIAGCNASPIKPLESHDVFEAAGRIRSGLAGVRSLYYPDVRPLPGVRCSIYGSKPNFFLRASMWSKEELEVGMCANLMWFWMRSHDPRFAYVYEEEDAMLVADFFRPDIILSVMLAGVPEDGWTAVSDLAKATVKEGDHERTVYIDSEKVVKQEITRGGMLVGTVDVIEFNEKDAVFFPRKIRVKTPENEIVVFLGEVEVNGPLMNPKPSRRTKELIAAF